MDNSCAHNHSLLAVVLLQWLDWNYRRLLRRKGLSSALRAYQAETNQRLFRSRLTIDEVLGSYHMWRRPLKQGEDAHDCLFRSLALGTALKRIGVGAELCIGITDKPFTSHAWVEAGGELVNDRTSRCARYRVIGRF